MVVFLATSSWYIISMTNEAADTTAYKHNLASSCLSDARFTLWDFFLVFLIWWRDSKANAMIQKANSPLITVIKILPIFVNSIKQIGFTILPCLNENPTPQFIATPTNTIKTQCQVWNCLFLSSACLILKYMDRKCRMLHILYQKWQI